VEVESRKRLLSLGDSNVFLGSCFAEHVGRRFQENCLTTMVNPLGVMYNPMSLSQLLTTQQSDPQEDYVRLGGMWHTWMGDGSLSRLDREECRKATDAALAELHEALLRANNLFLTLGTSHCYRLLGRGQVVANCHRMPASEFAETELSVEEIVDALDMALVALRQRNTSLQVVLTVSPYRYQKYGFHQSQLSKSRLLLATETLCSRHADWVTYFPAYELVLDELRDYRFYADDMLHPSSAAIDYVWQRLVEAWMDDEVRCFLQRWEPIRQALAHRPLHPESPEYEAFQQKTREQLAQLKQDFPMISF